MKGGYFMQTWHKEIRYENKNPFSESVFTETSIFFDIETTGFSPSNTTVYLIGCARRKGDFICVDQFFAESPKEEKLLLTAFLDLLGQYDTIITFNGIGFDIPYLKAKCDHYGMNEDFSDFSYIDIFKSLSKFRHLFKLPNFKQKTVEKFLGLEREDLYSGGELINIYHDYVENPDAQQADLLKLHNYEDVLGMVDLLPILTYLQLFQGAFSIQTIEKNIYEDYSRTSKDECIFTLKNLYPVPKRISFGYENIYFTCYQDTTKISIRIYDGELKYFYPNYKDYYYLPHEDTAVHKSVAFYVDKDYRTKAKAATCYSKKTGCFLPQYEVVVSPYFKLEYHDKMSYFELTDDFWDDENTVRQYIMHIFSILLQQSGKKQK